MRESQRIRWGFSSREKWAGAARASAWTMRLAMLSPRPRLLPAPRALSLALGVSLLLFASSSRADVLVDEHFDDSDVAARGWFDATNVIIDTSGCQQGDTPRCTG